LFFFFTKYCLCVYVCACMWVCITGNDGAYHYVCESVWLRWCISPIAWSFVWYVVLYFCCWAYGFRVWSIANQMFVFKILHDCVKSVVSFMLFFKLSCGSHVSWTRDICSPIITTDALGYNINVSNKIYTC